jgi:N-ethylmaleimide reductase
MSFQDIIKIGNLTLKNRIVMAAMTRQRASLDGIPGELVAKYYAQRAGAGLLLTEALAVSNISNAFPGAGCLYNQTQAEAWKKTTDAVKKRDGVIFAQLYHCGRNASPVATGFPTIAPSAIAPRGNIWGKESYTVPKEMTIADIDKVKE